MDAIDLKKLPKVHRKAKSGAKADKREAARRKKKGINDKDRHNPRAFSVANIGRTKRNMQRNLDQLQSKEVVPLRSASSDLVAPYVVAVVGPPSCGKSTLIRSLVKLYTNQNMTSTTGPITVAANKHRKITFLEVANDIFAMMDSAKIADIVLLVVDGSYGFEMETFEYLNILQLHGMPKVVGVVTHMDKFKTKKALKHRFWTEIYDGAKMFEFTGVVNNKYLKHEVKRLSLYLSRIKTRPLIWRNSHPYVVIDRLEDTTPSSVPTESDRTLSLYGYTRGSHLKNNQLVHIPGAGDYTVSSITVLPDPIATSTSLKKESLLYAPYSNTGRLVTDTEGTYIELKEINYSKQDMLEPGAAAQNTASGAANGNDPTPMQLLQSMQDIQTTVDRGLKGAKLSLFEGGEGIDNYESEEDVVDESDNDDDESEGEGSASDDEEKESENESEGDLDYFDDEYESDDNDVDESDTYYSNDEEDASGSNVAALALEQYRERSKNKAISWHDRIYEQKSTGTDEAVEESDDEDLFKVKAPQMHSYDDCNRMDSHRLDRSAKLKIALQDALSSSLSGLNINEKFLRNKFVTGDWGKSVVAGNESETDESEHSDNYSDDGSEFGSVEDMETGEKISGSKDPAKSVLEIAMNSDNLDAVAIDEQLREMNAAKKAAAKLGDDDEEKAEEDEDEDESASAAKLKERMLSRAEMNRIEFGEESEQSRLLLEGARSGCYVRISISGVPVEFTRNFNPAIPVIVGGVAVSESKMGIVTARVKRHRWHKRILKSQDPLVLSMGWRRFQVYNIILPVLTSQQTLPIYCITDDTSPRVRMLKYTPQHMHCHMAFYGPLVPTTTGILAVQKLSSRTANFRIAATGSVIENSANPQIVKKLKLVGTPTKIFKNTAFITGMFSSALEVAKYEGAKLKTVSGIRGTIKKSVRSSEKSSADKEGDFRATFEDKIVMSDLVVCRLWVPVEVKPYYNPVMNLLTTACSASDAPAGDGNTSTLEFRDDVYGWSGVRPMAQLRKEQAVPIPVNPDSVYKPITRAPKVFGKLVVPKKLQEALPFASKPKMQSKANKNTYMARRSVVVEPGDRKARAAVQILATIKNDKVAKRKEANQARSKEKQKQLERQAAKFAGVHAEAKKRKYREEGKEQLRREQKRARNEH